MTTVEVSFRGPFLAQDPSGALRQAMHSAVDDLVSLGEQRLDRMLRPRPAGVFLSVERAGNRASVGHYRRSLQSAVHDLEGTISDGGVLYGPWLEGTSSRNQTTRFKGYASFRRTGQWLQRQAQRISNHHLQRWARGMNR